MTCNDCDRPLFHNAEAQADLCYRCIVTGQERFYTLWRLGSTGRPFRGPRWRMVFE